MAAPALDDLAAIWADICLLCDRHGSKLLNGKVSLLPDLLMTGRHWADSDGHGNVGYVPMATTGYLEQAKLAAQRTFIPGTESAGAGQDDVAATAFLAWSKEERAGRCLDAALATLAMIASQALARHRARGAAGAAIIRRRDQEHRAAGRRRPRARTGTRAAERVVHAAGVRGLALLVDHDLFRKPAPLSGSWSAAVTPSARWCRALRRADRPACDRPRRLRPGPDCRW